MDSYLITICKHHIVSLQSYFISCLYEYINMRGIINHSSECYAISCIQLLCNIPYFKEDCMRIIPNHQPHPLLHAWMDVCKEMQSSDTSPISILSFMTEFAKTQTSGVEFKQHQQCDASEFVICLVDQLHTLLARQMSLRLQSNDPSKSPIHKLAILCYTQFHKHQNAKYSILSDLFYSISCNKLETHTPRHQIQYLPEPSFVLFFQPYSSSDMPSIYDYMDAYIKPDNIQLGNGSLMTKTTMFWSLPTILILCIPKCNNGVRINQQLNLSKYIMGYNKITYNYSLVGICNHSGNERCGHYSAIVKSAKDGNWYNCNDESIAQIHLPNTFDIKTAYLVVYIRVGGIVSH